MRLGWASEARARRSPYRGGEWIVLAGPGLGGRGGPEGMGHAMGESCMGESCMAPCSGHSTGFQAPISTRSAWARRRAPCTASVWRRRAEKRTRNGPKNKKMNEFQVTVAVRGDVARIVGVVVVVGPPQLCPSTIYSGTERVRRRVGTNVGRHVLDRLPLALLGPPAAVRYVSQPLHRHRHRRGDACR